MNKYFDEMNSYYEDLESSSQLGVHGPPPRKYSASEQENQKTVCAKKALQNCFASSVMTSYTNHSCLYRRFILNEEDVSTASAEETSTTAKTTSKAETSTVFLRQYVQNESPSKLVDVDSASPSKGQNNKYQTREAAELENGEHRTVNSNLVWKKLTIEDSLTAITVGIAVVFLLSVISLFIGIYLIYKRKTFVYHPANDSSYPHDER